MNSKSIRFLLGTALLGVFAAQSHAMTTLVTDDFASNSQGSWIVRGSGSAAFGTGAAVLTVGGDNQPEAIYRSFNTVSLANAGDYLLLTADVSVSWTTSNGGAVRIGLGYADPAFSDGSNPASLQLGFPMR